MGIKALLLTLGHNSSAILLEDGEVLCGYEEERLSLIKSDSSFPKLAIEQIQKFYEIPDDIEIFISHWFLNANTGLHENSKWFDRDYLVSKFPNHNIFSLDNEQLTHHDAHAYSAYAYSKDFVDQSKVYYLVADGFGTQGECISIYNKNLNIIYRKTGFFNSLGLMYQYATSYLGLKENKDEYKMLGFQSSVTEHHYGAISKLKKYMLNGNRIESDLSDLKYVKAQLHDKLRSLNLHTNADVAHVVQSVLEEILIDYVKRYVPVDAHLVLSGGVFMNVKLNQLLSTYVNKLSVMPLCGDQGAAIGVYESVAGDFKWPGHLFWGKRHLDSSFDNDFKTKAIIDILNDDGIVNVVRENMEFGARALCNTSTLAIPSERNCQYINMVNQRESTMPMAPVIHEKDFDNFFEASNVIDSMKYMICTAIYKDNVSGVSNKIPFSNSYSGRPQLINDDHWLAPILEATGGILINTSYNEHGMPIVYSQEDAERCGTYNDKYDNERRINTFIFSSEE